MARIWATLQALFPSQLLMDGLDVFPLLFFVEFVDVLTIKNFPLLLEHFEVVVVVLDKEFGPGRDV